MSQQEYTHYHRIFSEDRNLSSFPLHAETIDSIQHDNLSASQLNTCKSINTAESEIMADPINPTKFKPWKKKRILKKGGYQETRSGVCTGEE